LELIIKYLDKWDKDHCYKEKDKGNSTRLYKKLIDYYKKNNLINEEKNLRRIKSSYSFSKTKNNFRKNNFDINTSEKKEKNNDKHKKKFDRIIISYNFFNTKKQS